MVHQCTDCPLSQTRTNAVPGEGPDNADLMFIGEGPGFREDQQGRPFVGPAGQFLDGLLASIGTNRRQVFIANMIKCRPPENRDPMPHEISACQKYLQRQIETGQSQAYRHAGPLLPGIFLSWGKHQPGPGQAPRKRRAQSLPGNAPCRWTAAAGVAGLHNPGLPGDSSYLGTTGACRTG